MDEIKLQSIHDKHWDVVLHRGPSGLKGRAYASTTRRLNMSTVGNCLRYEVSCLA